MGQNNYSPRGSMDTQDLRLLIIANDPLARAGLAALLTERPGFTVVGQVEGVDTLPTELDVYRPDVLVWDLGWEPTPALEQLIDLRDLQLAAVILLPGPEQAADAWAAGARCLLLRSANADTLLAASLAAAQELVTIDPSLTNALIPNPSANIPPLVEALTPREEEVLQLLAEGLPNKSIARRLEISEHTVKFHVNAIMGKLSAQSRTEAVVRATQLGLILL